MRLLNGIETQDRPILGLDWQRSKVDVYNPITKGFKEFKNLEEAAETHPGYMFIFEAPAESYELQRRDRALKALQRLRSNRYMRNDETTNPCLCI